MCEMAGARSARLECQRPWGVKMLHGGAASRLLGFPSRPLGMHEEITTLYHAILSLRICSRILEIVGWKNMVFETSVNDRADKMILVRTLDVTKNLPDFLNLGNNAVA